ncbi:MAG: N-6 DNA methylase [Gemmatimonadaceae bacterium]
MLTLRAAARLLEEATSLQALRPLAAALGHSAPQPVPPSMLRTLGIHDLVGQAELASGPDAMCCLTAQLHPHPSASPTTALRERLQRLATTLALRAPTRDWSVVALDADAQHVALAAIAPHPSGPRIAALRVERAHIVDSDAETLRSLASIDEPDGPLHHARLLDILGRDALSTRFYRALERTVSHLADSATGTRSGSGSGTASGATVATHQERRELAILCASRCLFLAFLEAKGWLNQDRQFLLRQVTDTLQRGGRLQTRLLRPLFFGTLNTPLRDRAPAAQRFGAVPFLNGGLFAPTPLERARRSLHFTDDAIASLIGDLLDRYRFTAHEDSSAWSEAAVDPEMLGRAFESLMAHTERRQSGTFFTPPTLVETAVREALATALPSLPTHIALGAPLGTDATPLPAHLLAPIRALRVLDPACGSGAFLVQMLDALTTLAHRCGDPRPLDQLRRDVLVRQIFGVDRNPMAVWLCELRLWLAIVIDCPITRIADIPPLPNLDHHIRVGDTLAGGDFRHAPPSARRLTRLRDSYTRAAGRRKRHLATALDREERRRADETVQQLREAIRRERRDTVRRLRTPDLFGQRPPRSRSDTQRLMQLRQHARELTAESQRITRGGALPFRFAAQFADVAAAGGFHLVIGNPPWVRPHALPVHERMRLRQDFLCMRQAPWHAGAARAGAGAGFSAQADLAAAFVERSLQLTAPGGISALLLPAKLWRTLAGGGIRAWLHDQAHVRTLQDWSLAPALFDAAVYPSLLVAERRSTPTVDHPVRIAVTHGRTARRFVLRSHPLPLAGEAAAPWLLLPDDARSALEALRTAGPALGDAARQTAPFSRPLLGVKCGCNDAFLVELLHETDDWATITAHGREARIERERLRPIARGESAHSAADSMERIVWTHDHTDAPLRRLPTATARWLAPFQSQLERRQDARGRTAWWTLFRTEAARHDCPRLIWADLGRQLRPRILEAGDPTVPLNSCYLLRTPALDDAWALDILLSSPIAAAWFAALAEPARGGFKRFLGWTVASLPLPAHWEHARRSLVAFRKDLRRRGLRAPADCPEEHTAVVAAAYGIPLRTLSPLLQWSTP